MGVTMSNNRKVDACIIGSGAGGAVVAKELSEKGMTVVVLEAGMRFDPLKDYTAALQDWERKGTENRESSFMVPSMGRVTYDYDGITSGPDLAFGVGGATLVYLAYMPRFRPDDFRVRTLDGVGEDWPLAYEDLAPYYSRVELELGVSGQNGDPWHPHTEPYPNPPFELSYANKIMKRGCDKLGIRVWPVPVGRNSRSYDGRPACIQCGDCENGCMTGAKASMDVTYVAKAEATGRVEIRPQSVATQVTVDAQGRAKSVLYFDRDKVEREQEADIIIVSAGTFFSPRILLNSKSALFPEGIANSSGTVGKYFMQHMAYSCRAVFDDRIDSFSGFLRRCDLKGFCKNLTEELFCEGMDH